MRKKDASASLRAARGRGPTLRRQGAAYQGAIEAVFAIPVAIGIGYFVDRRFETDPVFVFVGVGVGFAAFVMRLWRLGRELQKAAEEDAGGRGDERGE